MGALDLTKVMHEADVLVPDGDDDLGFAQKALEDLRPGGGEAQHLESDTPVELGVLGQVNGAHAAGTKLAEDAVAVKLRRQLAWGRQVGPRRNSKGGRLAL